MKYVGPPPSFWLYGAYANSALPGKGVLFAAKKNAQSKMQTRSVDSEQKMMTDNQATLVSESSESPEEPELLKGPRLFSIGIHISPQDTPSRNVEFCLVEDWNDWIVSARVLLQTEQEDSPVTSVEIVSPITLSERDREQDVRLSRALSAVLEYVYIESETIDPGRELLCQMWKQQGYEIESSNMVKASICERSSEMDIGFHSLFSDGQFRDLSHYEVSSDLKVIPSGLGAR